LALGRRKALQNVPIEAFNHTQDIESLVHTNFNAKGGTNPLPDTASHYASSFLASSNFSKDATALGLSQTCTSGFHPPDISAPYGHPEPTSKLILPLIPYHPANSSASTFVDNSWRLNFPLPSDQHLITLSQYNVLRATLTNMKIMSLLHTMPTECGGAFCT